MNFENLVNKYSVDFEIIPKTGGSYVGGEFVAEYGSPRKARGTIVSFPRKKIYQSGGHLSSKDLHLYTLQPITDKLDDIKIRYNNSIYSVEEDIDYSIFAGVNTYVLKWVSNFEKSATASA